MNELEDVLDQLKAEKSAKEAALAIDQAQMKALFDTSAARAFFAQLALKLEIKPDPSVETANVDGKTIRYSPSFVASQDADAVHYVMVGHEPIHCHLMHMVRGSGMDCDECRQMAADGEDNEMCLAAGFKPGSLAESILLPGKGPLKDCVPGETFEQHYARLHAKHKQCQNGQCKASQDPGKCGSFSPAKDEAHAQQIEAEWRGKIAAAAQEVGRKMAEGKLKGDLPGSLRAWVDAILHPKPHWRETLRDFVTQSLRKKNDNDWARPSRRGLAAGIYLPQHRGEELGHLIVHVDCSGSTMSALPEFASEIGGILACDPCRVTILYGDTELQGEPVEWKPDDGEFKLEQRGCGGTDHRHLEQWVRGYDGDDELVAVIALSDGETVWPGDYGVPTLWVITPDGSTNAPFGRVVKMQG
jgi:predicted metal-dependent peptidase